ncbi:hypothetical protein BH23PLA1_BH23PLA1_18670 [soil metagenome]
MVSCKPFEFSIPGDVGTFIGTLGRMVAEHRGILDGDETSGKFSIPSVILGTIEGNYEIQGQTARVQITRRPILLPCRTIEQFVLSRIPAAH